MTLSKRLLPLVLALLWTLCLLISTAGAKKKHSKQKLQSRETDIFTFMRLLVMRLIYGFASWMGWSEGLSELFGGAFVPPGADEDDYGDIGGLDY